MKLIFFGTPDISVKLLESLIRLHKVVAVVTQPDRPVKRSKAPVPTPISITAINNDIPVYKPETISDDLAAELRGYDADLFVTFAFGLIFKKNILDITKFGGINVHPSLLPELRGPSPIQTAVLLGKTKIGVTIQTIKLKVDAGDILLQKELDINGDDICTIEKKVSELATNMTLEVLSDFERYYSNKTVQDDTKATYCRMINKDDGLIDWNCSGKEIVNKIRAYSNRPVAFSYVDKRKLNIYKASINNTLDFEIYKKRPNGEIVALNRREGVVVKASDCLINLEVLQQEGKKILECKNFVNGCQSFLHKILSKET
ncbi:MAG TPA: methionyl-tRNA formyltransferase [Spirochaetota bacterium]|nr:methionyl-tRNA formyltransferase [Spirochaetota bacterium]HOS33500.1 methionyl-tRNA formyltransferase [Spirochaetota bacterium]HOS55735.1 methionyl-tRNA formyltransferase [Spirochaetota bacterium]HPK61583.1 methionyl-tRNA formyltransferase [Spirochaetota bacterium]HQF78349.1 methionyl-tRNA formyltransferase [Spirochaetota bacterium]